MKQQILLFFDSTVEQSGRCATRTFFFDFTVISYSLRVLLTNVFLFFTTAFLYHVEKLRSIIEIALLSVQDASGIKSLMEFVHR